MVASSGNVPDAVRQKLLDTYSLRAKVEQTWDPLKPLDRVAAVSLSIKEDADMLGVSWLLDPAELRPSSDEHAQQISSAAASVSGAPVVLSLDEVQRVWNADSSILYKIMKRHVNTSATATSDRVATEFQPSNNGHAYYSWFLAASTFLTVGRQQTIQTDVDSFKIDLSDGP